MINELKFNDSTPIDIPIGITIFCDMDGTLVGTDYANYLSYKRALTEVTNGMLDIEFTEERINREKLKERHHLLTNSQLEIISSLKEEYFTEFISETQLNKALVHLISKSYGNNILILVAFSRKKRALEVLKNYKLLEFFNRLICREDLPQGGSSNKYENAIKLMEVSCESVFIFENDNVCIEEAMRAGVPKKNIYKVFIE